MKPQSCMRILFLALLFFSSVFPQFVVCAEDAEIAIDGSSVLGTFSDDLLGNNAAVWESSLNGKDTVCNKLMLYSGQRLIRYPGGSYADILAWDTMGTSASPTHSWCVDNEGIIAFANSFGAKLQAIVNFSGFWDNVQHSHAEAVQKAVDWVKYMNITRKLGVKYWEIGNEIFGTWEQGCTTGSDYGNRFADFYTAMKAVDPSIMIGAVASPYEWDYDHWMEGMLGAAKAKGVIPDFLVIHMYPNNFAMNEKTNPRLLQSVKEISRATESLNKIVSKFIGPEYVGKIKYHLTEYRSVLDKRIQMNTYIDAMFSAQLILEMAKYGWGGANLWNIKNGADKETGADFGFIDNTNNKPRPTYFIFPFLAGKFGRTLVSTTSSHNMIKAYAAKDDAGNMTLFIVNNSPDTDLSAQINIKGFKTGTKGAMWVLEPAGITPDGKSTPIQGRTDISINGIVHPDPSTLEKMAGKPVKTGQSFTVYVPKSSMIFMKVPKARRFLFF